MVYLICSLLFVAFYFVIAALLSESSARRLAQRVKDAKSDAYVVLSGSALDSQLSKHVVARLVGPRFTQLLRGVSGLAPATVLENARKRIDRAGYPASALTTFMILKLCCLALGALCVVAAPVVLPTARVVGFGIGVCVCVMLIALPDYVVVRRIRARQGEVRRSLPDVLDLLLVSTEAGQGLDGAMSVVSRNQTGPLPDELGRWLAEVQFGKSREHAWRDMADRVAVNDLNTLINAIQQGDRMGVSIANTLRNQAAAIRARRSQMIRRLAATMAVKMVFPLVICIMPAMYVVLLAPGMMSITEAFRMMGP